jgi:transposase
MLDIETIARIRHLFHAEHWKIGTIANDLGLHFETVRIALETDRFNNSKSIRTSITDPYADSIRQILEQYPRLRATRVFQMIRDRGYKGNVVQLRRFIACIRPTRKEAFLRLSTFPGEQGQVDWASFGEVRIGHARRKLSCFVITLSYSRALYLEFFFDQRMENFLRGHINAFEDWQGLPRILLYDNLRSVVLERRGDAIHFNPRILELSAHYHFAPRPCQVRAGNEKGRVERVIRYIRESFFAARPFTTLADFNRQALAWRDREAHGRAWPGGDHKIVRDAYAEELPLLLPLPVNRFESDFITPVRSGKTIYVRFDLNDYSIPPNAVGKQLLLVASTSTVRILDGSVEIARHHRSYSRHELILFPDHQEALLAEKQKAVASTPSNRLSVLIPEAKEFFDAVFQRRERVASHNTQLLRLLDEFGATELRVAMKEALDQNMPRASSVAFILNRRRRLSRRRSLIPVDLSRRPDLADIDIKPHNPETYDELIRNNDDDESEQ